MSCDGAGPAEMTIPRAKLFIDSKSNNTYYYVAIVTDITRNSVIHALIFWVHRDRYRWKKNRRICIVISLDIFLSVCLSLRDLKHSRSSFSVSA